MRSPETRAATDDYVQIDQWRLLAEVLTVLPQAKVEEHLDTISGSSLVVTDRRWPRRHIVVSAQRGMELLAEIVFEPMPWCDVREMGHFEAARRAALSLGSAADELDSPLIAPVRARVARGIARRLALGVVDDGEWWVRAIAPVTAEADLFDSVVGEFPSLADAAAAEFESVIAGAQPRSERTSGWIVFRNEQPTWAFTDDGLTHTAA